MFQKSHESPFTIDVHWLGQFYPRVTTRVTLLFWTDGISGANWVIFIIQKPRESHLSMCVHSFGRFTLEPQ